MEGRKSSSAAKFAGAARVAEVKLAELKAEMAAGVPGERRFTDGVVGAYLGCSDRTVRRARELGHLASARVAGRWRSSPADIRAYLERCPSRAEAV